jgi:hypothetical protein
VSDSEFDGEEPVLGLPERLPPGESQLWQGTPRWRVLARHAFHTRKVALYFALLMVWRIADDVSAGAPLGATLRGCGWLALLGATVLGLLLLLAYFCARCTVYTITTRRLVIRHGMALPMSVNVPWSIVAGADLRLDKDGTGEIALKLQGARLGYLLTWPNVRPWHFKSPQPMLRAVPGAREVAAQLIAAIATDAAASGSPGIVTGSPGIVTTTAPPPRHSEALPVGHQTAA